MIEWPQSLIEELAARRGLIFLGAGASMGATKVGTAGEEKSPPEWKSLLMQLATKIPSGSTEDLKQATHLIDIRSYLEAAEIIKSHVLEADYSRLIRENFSGFDESEIHSHICKIDQKFVVTTNYDCIYENLCQSGSGRDGYKVLSYYDQNLVSSLRSPVRLIIKAHGCMKTPERTVLTKSEYFSARQYYGPFFNVLESLFLTNTILFIGYSISDPDIQLILENSSITARSSHPHYAVMPIGIHSSIKSAFKKAYNIQIIEYDPVNKHEVLEQSLQELADAVEVERN